MCSLPKLQGSGYPGTPIALITKGGVDVKGNLKALTSSIAGQLTGKLVLAIWALVCS